MTTGNLDLDTFPKLLTHHSRERGERPAIREKSRGIWRTVTWRELAEEAAALAAAASARGLQRGAHVALLGDNRPRLYAAMCAAQWLGAIVVPLYQDATADEIASSIESAKVTHVFAENQEQVDKLLEILPRCPTVRCIVYDKDRGMRHYQQRELVSYDSLLQQGRELAAEKRDFLQAEAARGRGQDSAFVFFTSGTTGPAKGVVLTHASLIDRARVAASMGELKDTDVAMAYLPPGWIGQNLFGYVQPMVVGYCICCPESSDTMLADMREMGPTYFLATPRVLETLAKQVSLRMEEAGGFNQGLYRYCMAVARRVSARTLAGETAFDPRSAGVDGERSFDARPAPRRARDEQCARGLYGRRCDRSRSPDVFSRAGNQPEAALRLHRNRILRRDAARRCGQAGHGWIAGRRRRTENDAAARDPGALTRPFQGIPRRLRKRRRGQKTPRAGFTPATPVTSAPMGNCGSSTAWPMSAH